MPKYKSVIPTLGRQGHGRRRVLEAIKESKDNTFTNEAYVGTLENGGAYLAPFHDFDSKVSDRDQV
jgi:basic membrane protein A